MGLRVTEEKEIEKVLELFEKVLEVEGKEKNVRRLGMKGRVILIVKMTSCEAKQKVMEKK